MPYSTRLQENFRHIGLSLGVAVLVALSGPAIAQAEKGQADIAAHGEALDLRPEDAADTCDGNLAQIRVTVNGVKPHGLLTVEVYNDDRDNFLSSEGRLRRVRVAAGASPQTVCIGVAGAGTYAVAAYHDEDGDRKLGRKWNFLPKEPFALSNNPALKLRKPRHSEAAFQAGALGADITVNLRGT